MFSSSERRPNQPSFYPEQCDFLKRGRKPAPFQKQLNTYNKWNEFNHNEKKYLTDVLECKYQDHCSQSSKAPVARAG